MVRSVSGLVLLQLLLPLPELPLRVAHVAAEAVGVEVVVAAGLCERLSLLKTKSMNEFTHESFSLDSTTSLSFSSTTEHNLMCLGLL